MKALKHLDGVAMLLVFALAVCADSVMDVYGPVWFALVYAVGLAACWIMIEVANAV